MKASLTFVPLSFALLAIATPLGDRAIFRKLSGTPQRGARRFILESRFDSPPACLAKTVPPLDTANPNLSNSTVPVTANTTSTDVGKSDAGTNTTTADDTTLTADNTTALTRRLSKTYWRRIAQQDLPDVAQSWQDLCLVSGGDIFTNDPCVKLAGFDGIDALLGNADPCAQQDNADAMITFAKSAGVTNTDELIANAIAYRQHPRNAIEILGVVPSTMYCQRAPENPELIGIVNGQLEGVDPGLFGSPSVPIVPFGAPGTCPFGQTADTSTCSCVNDTAASGNTTDSTSGNVSDISDTTDVSTASTAEVTDVTSTADASASATNSGVTSATDVVTTTSAAAGASVTNDTASETASASASSASSLATSASSLAVSATTTTKSSGPNVQPSGISGDVNDING